MTVAERQGCAYCIITIKSDIRSLINISNTRIQVYLHLNKQTKKNATYHKSILLYLIDLLPTLQQRARRVAAQIFLVSI